MISWRAFARIGLLLALIAGPTAQSKQLALVVGGLGGEAEYEERFKEQAKAVADAALHADERAQVVTLSGAKATRDAIKKALAEFANASPEDQLVVTLIGHGTFDGEEYRYNVPGPDVTATELRSWLQAIPVRRQLVVVATSASGAAVQRLQSDNRVVITATKSGGERNAVRFAEHWVAALRSTEADRDKNEWVTAQEAFDYAVRKVADAFKSNASLATEHARLEGKHAESMPLGRLGATRQMPQDAILIELFAARLKQEDEVEAVKGRKAQMAADAYYDELEKSLVALAKTQQRIDARQAALEKEGS